MNQICGLAPYQFIHILDETTNITRLEVGPKSVALLANEKLVAGPLPMVTIPPGNYCIVLNPVSHYEAGKVCELRLGHSEVRYNAGFSAPNKSSSDGQALHMLEPFALYPGESLSGAAPLTIEGGWFKKAIKQLPVIKANTAIRLQCSIDHKDGKIVRRSGETWQLDGPLTYIPRPEVEIVSTIEAIIIEDGNVVRLRALEDCIDKSGKHRVTGEEWLVSKPGAYLPRVFEEIVGVETKMTLTLKDGLHLIATQSVTDVWGIDRVAGDEWLVTGDDTEEYFPEIGVEVSCTVEKTILQRGEYCVVLDPVNSDGQPMMGMKELRTGCCSFFLHPGERLEHGIQKAHILSADESLVLQCTSECVDKMFKGAPLRNPGDRWLITGPVRYIPPIEVTILKKRRRIALNKNEGIYVQDLKTGQVRAVLGPRAYMLTADEELWEKPLRPIEEELLRAGGGIGEGDIRKLAYFAQSINPDIVDGRDKTRVITYRCPGNTAVQVYNYMKKTQRILFGPDLVVLGPHDEFNVLSLSAGKPKKENALKSLCLMLGPDFITDILEVETSDHARLRVRICFNNHFEYVKGDQASEAKLFAVPDFIGFACKRIGSKIRAAVAFVPFDEFHRHSVKVIHTAVFGMDEDGKLHRQLKFPANNLVVTNIDIQSIEPSDPKMRDSLSKSVQLAIEISTRSIEASAFHEAERNEQIARGELERQKLLNEKESEKERAKLLELQAISAAIESCGQAKAEAQAQAERVIIECHSEIEAVTLKAEAKEIEHEANLESQNLVRSNEIKYLRRQNELELFMKKQKAEIEVNRLREMVGCMGSETLASMARAGPDLKVKFLEALGVKDVLFADASNPINLFTNSGSLIDSTN
ncbi:major vault protein-like [Gigantopelta aegis]|uniref:major vault protein-like n=1 Tax=Gigantopelta aegis TaxID=1735272 RepID=UPI001B88B93C|nr:major vault protein-like [Gigantopelta aegis]